MNEDWQPSLGGEFRIYNPIPVQRPPAAPASTTPADGSGDRTDTLGGKLMSLTGSLKNELPALPGAPYTDISPAADRLLVFWSDRLVHSVQVTYVLELR